MKKVAVVTGGSSGIGFCAAKELKNSGYTVYTVSRHENPTEGINYLCADLTDEKEIKRAVSEVLKKEGRIDVLVNNAGMGISGAVEFTNTEDAKKLFDVNFFGMVRMCREILPIMRDQKCGRIVNVGSVAGVIPIPFQTYYSASKAAINSYTMALANEVRPFGITVCVLMPGDIKTGFTKAREKFHEGDDIYCGRIERSVAAMEKDEQNGMSPERVGAYIAKLCGKKNVKPLYSLGLMYKSICVAARLFPVRPLNRIVGFLYAEK